MFTVDDETLPQKEGKHFSSNVQTKYTLLDMNQHYEWTIHPLRGFRNYFMSPLDLDLE